MGLLLSSGFFLVAAQRVERLKIAFRAVDPPLVQFFVRSWKAVLRPVACNQDPGARGRGQGTETLAELGGVSAVAQLVFRSALTPEHAEGRCTARRAFQEIASASCLGCCLNDDPRGARHWHGRSRHNLVFGRSNRIGTMMQSYASAAELRGGGSILFRGAKAMSGIGTPPPRFVICGPVVIQMDRRNSHSRRLSCHWP
jgi:hypothetical protein